MSFKCLLLEGINKSAYNYLSQISSSIKIDQIPNALSEDELLTIFEKTKYDFIGIRSKTKITKKFLDNNQHLLAIGCFCIGTNQVDLETSAKYGIPVFHSPYGNTRSVAELIIGIVISLARNLGDRNIQMHNGIWKKTHNNSYEIRNKILGIVGYGHIGSQVSVLAESIGMKVIYYDPAPVMSLGNAISKNSLEELVQEADFITLHVPALESTKNLITYQLLQQFKPNSYLINYSRGSVINIPELKQFCQDYPNHFAGLAIDVYPVEPKKSDDFFEEARLLGQLPNTILTPHIGGATEEAQTIIGEDMAQKAWNYLSNGQIVEAVNLPNLRIINPNDIPNTIRFTNIHINVKGILKQIMEILDDYNMNIVRQFLKSDTRYSYVWMEFSYSQEQEKNNQIEEIKKEIISRIEMIPENIKTRYLA